MRKLYIVVTVCLLFSLSICQAQTKREVLKKQDSLNLYPSKFGLLFNYNLNSHPASFSKITDYSFCNPGFEDGSGSGLSFGALYEYQLSKKLSIGARLVYLGLDGSFSSSEYKLVGHMGDSVTGKINYEFDAYLNTVALEPTFNYNVFKDLNLHLGANVGFLLTKNFDQLERIVEPDGVPFSDGEYVHNQFSDIEITNASSFQASILAGASYELPMSENFIIAPEISYQYALTNIASDLDWKVNSLRLGASIKYKTPRPCPPGMFRNEDGDCKWIPCPKNKIRDEEGECVCRNGMFLNEEGECVWVPCPEKNQRRNREGDCEQYLYAETEAELISPNGLPTGENRINIYEFPSEVSHPLLNYIFFDKDKQALPDRYDLFSSSEQTKDFDEKKLAEPEEMLGFYHNILNIIGSRMFDNPFSNITLTTYQFKPQDNATPKNRIAAVKDYLNSIWKIPEYRINEKIYSLPAEIAQKKDEKVLAEYRRVEIVPDSNSIEMLDPVVVKNKIYKFGVDRTHFKFDVIPLTEIKNWSFKVKQDDETLLDSSGTGQTPNLIVWNLPQRMKRMKLDYDSVVYALEVTDENGDKATKEKKIDLNWIYFEEDKEPEPGDSSYAIYYIIFKHKDISKDLKNNIFVLENIRLNRYKSSVNITGYTDIYGNLKKNELLSHERAEAIKKYFIEKRKISPGRISAVGYGSVELFDNTLPEGRFYNRSVITLISTPLGVSVRQELDFTCCYLMFSSIDDEITAKSVLDYLQQRNIKGFYIEEWTDKFDKKHYRVRTNCFDDIRKAVIERSKLAKHTKDFKINAPLKIKCTK